VCVRCGIAMPLIRHLPPEACRPHFTHTVDTRLLVINCPPHLQSNCTTNEIMAGRLWLALCCINVFLAPGISFSFLIVPAETTCSPNHDESPSGGYIDLVYSDRFAFYLFVSFYLCLGRLWFLYESRPSEHDDHPWIASAFCSTLIGDATVAVLTFGLPILCHTGEGGDQVSGGVPASLRIPCDDKLLQAIVIVTLLGGSCFLSFVVLARTCHQL
jgi:hypothetical protein